MCEECGETGHSANKCPIRPCNACGLRSHKLQTSHLCPEHVCTLCNGEEQPKGHNHNICPRAECQTCKLSGHVAKDCIYTNCLDVDVDWFNLLFTKSDAPCRRTLQKSTANGVKNTARSNSTSTTSTSCPCPRRRSTQPLLLRRRTLQLRLRLSNSTRAPHGDQLRLIALPMQTPPAHSDQVCSL